MRALANAPTEVGAKRFGHRSVTMVIETPQPPSPPSPGRPEDAHLRQSRHERPFGMMGRDRRPTRLARRCHVHDRRPSLYGSPDLGACVPSRARLHTSPRRRRSPLATTTGSVARSALSRASSPRVALARRKIRSHRAARPPARALVARAASASADRYAAWASRPRR